jgi:hypothetical protein
MVEPIVVKQGSMIIWHKSINYQVLPNNSNKPFCAQYVTMFEDDGDNERKVLVQNMVRMNKHVWKNKI